MRRKLSAVILAMVLSFCIPFSCLALTTKERLDQAQQQRNQTANEMNQSKDNLNNLQGQQNQLQGALQNLNNQLTEVSENLAEIEDKIHIKEGEIAETTAELENAQKKADDQYAAMKKRIQYLYENGDFGMMELLLKANQFSDMLNYYEYIEALSNYDRKMLVEYRQTRDDIAVRKQTLETEQEELAQIKVQQEAEQSRVSGLVSSTSNSIVAYADQISVTETQISQYEASIKEQDKNIAALKKQYEEELAMSRLAQASAKRDISQVTFAEGDRKLLANLIYCEAGAEPYEGKVAVGAVVINRLLSSVYPDTVTGVIYQNRQFSPVGSGRLALALAEDRATAACYQAADEAMSGVSNVGNCVYFRTPIEGLTGLSIGGHIFY
ncbi:MAG: cell wall hydrolase [Lachnospiraceae bacterium]|nr:cell wall hydrolase [Lachnospiraceae bacterium]